jgi:hypothetical protein
VDFDGEAAGGQVVGGGDRHVGEKRMTND